MFNEVRAAAGYQLTIDLPNNKIVKPDGATIPFELDAFKKECLINGWDTVGLTLRHEDKISAFEAAHA